MVVVSSGISVPYGVINMVYGFASKNEGCSGGIDSTAVYASAVKRLEESAVAMGADAVIHVSFQNRMAVGSGCTGRSEQVFEVFAWGTAVKVNR
jgi:hypothetical protein